MGPLSAIRMRLVAATVALVVCAPLAALGTAHAEHPARLAKPEREISIKGVEPRDDVFFARGKVRPDYKKRVAILQRKLKREKSWTNHRRFKTTGASRYRQRIHALRRPGVVCYRVKIKGNDHFKTSFSGRVCIRTRHV